MMFLVLFVLCIIYLSMNTVLKKFSGKKQCFPDATHCILRVQMYSDGWFDLFGCSLAQFGTLTSGHSCK